MKTFTVNELRENRAKAWENAKNFLESHRNEKGMLAPEDVATFEKMEAEIVGMGEEIKRAERCLALDAELSRPVGSPITNLPGAVGDLKTGRASNEYKAAMLGALRSNFRQVSNVLVEGTDSAGGFLVPEEYDTRLIEKLEQENVLRKLGTVIQTSGERKINVAATKPAASWVEESGALAFGDATFSQVILAAYKLSVAVNVSEELLADNQYDLEGYLIRSFGQAIADAEEEAFIMDNNSNKPTGMLDAAGHLLLVDGSLQPDLSRLFSGQIPQQLEGIKVEASFSPSDAGLSDDPSKGFVQGNIISIIYKGDHYKYKIRSKNDVDYYVDDEWLWNMEDYVSVVVPEEKMEYRRVDRRQ